MEKKNSEIQSPQTTNTPQSKANRDDNKAKAPQMPKPVDASAGGENKTKEDAPSPRGEQAP